MAGIRLLGLSAILLVTTACGGTAPSSTPTTAPPASAGATSAVPASAVPPASSQPTQTPAQTPTRTPPAIATATQPPSLTPTPAPTSTPGATATLAPTWAPTVTPGPDVPVETVIPPKATAPSRGLGITWHKRYASDGTATSFACGPVGCIEVLTYDGGGFPGPPTLAISSDLRTWTTRVASGPGLDAQVQSIAANGERYVLAGGGAWWSPDARRWTRARPTAGRRVPVDTVASDGRRFIGWQPYGAHAGIWFSAGGRRWQKVELPGAPALIVDAVGVVPGGGFVLAGRSGPTIAGLDAVERESVRFGALSGAQGVWTSPDGRTWTEVPIAVGMEDVRLTSIAGGGPGEGLLAAGLRGSGEGDQQPGIWRWTPADGWQRLSGPRLSVVELDQGTTRVIASPTRWLVIGRRADTDRRHDVTRMGVLAGSRDGRSWWGIDSVEFDGRGEYFIDGHGWAGGRLVLLVNRYWTGMDLGQGASELWVSP